MFPKIRTEGDGDRFPLKIGDGQGTSSIKSQALDLFWLDTGLF